jgi:FkbM family methyltransferase
MQYQNFDDIDFNKLYVEQKEKSTFKAKAKESWDKKAPSMNEKVNKSIYNEQFLKLLDLNEINSLLDVGCGVGNLSLRLAAKLSQVYSLDYSPKMLEILEENAKKKNISNIKIINTSWYDPWDEVPKADLVIASRSMEVKDMKEALIKLNDKANKKVVLSYKVGGSFVSNEILEVLKKDIIKKPDYIYLVNILYSMGIRASVNFVQSEGRGTIYSSKEKFIESVSWSIGDLSTNEIKSLENYYNNLDKNKIIDEEFVYWAIISWDKEVQ